MPGATEHTPLIAPDGEQFLPDEAPNTGNPASGETNVEPMSARVVMILMSLYLCVILAALDTTIVTTLLAHIASDLKQLDNISWAATGYTVAYSAFQPLYGKFSDIVGRKKVSIFSLVVFAIGCQICGMAYSLEVLVVGRFVSGIGAGGMLSMSTITVSDYVPLRMRGVFQGIGNICFGSGAALGGVFGGWITALGGWRLAFSAQVPLALFVTVVVWALVVDKQVDSNEVVTGENADHPVKRNSLERIDGVGCLSLVVALLLLMLAVTTGGNQFSWISLPIFAMLVASVGMLYFFVWWESNMAIEPVIPIPLLTHRTIMSACLTNFFGSAFAYAFIYYGPIFLQAMYQYSYTEVAHRLAANFLGVAVGSLGSGLYMRHTGKYWAMGVWSTVFMLLASVVYLMIPVLPYSWGASAVYQSVGYVLSGLGYASMLTITLVALISAAPPEFQATTTSAQYTFRGAGSSIGIATAAAIFQNTLVSQLQKRLHGKGHKSVIDAVSKSVDAIWDAPLKFREGILISYQHAGMAVFGFSFVLAILSGICSACQREHPLERS